MALSTNKIVGIKYDNRSGDGWSVNCVYFHILSTGVPGVEGCAVQVLKINYDDFLPITGFHVVQRDLLLNQLCYPVTMKNEKGNDVLQAVLFPGLKTDGTPIEEEKKAK